MCCMKVYACVYVCMLYACMLNACVYMCGVCMHVWCMNVCIDMHVFHCMYVGVICTCVVCLCVCIHVWRLQVDVRIFFYHAPTYSWYQGLSLNLEITSSVDQLASDCLWTMCLHYALQHWSYGHTTCNCLWEPRIQTQVSMLTKQVLYPLSHLSSPKLKVISHYLQFLCCGVPLHDTTKYTYWLLNSKREQNHRMAGLRLHPTSQE